MSTTVAYKGNTIATITDETKTLTTKGKICEDDITLTDVTPIPNLQTKNETYTPSTSQQTDAVTYDEGYTGLEQVNVTVNAMPAGAAGTPTITKAKTAEALTASVTFPDIEAGYIDAIAQVDVPFTIESKTATPGIASVDVTPTGNDYYLNKVHVNPIPSGYFIPSGTLSITENGTGYNCQNYAEVNVNVPGGVSGGLVHIGSLADQQVALKDTSFNGWTPSTTEKAILATASAGTFTATDIANNDYFVRQRAFLHVQYNEGTSNGKGLFSKMCVENWYALTRRPSNAANLNSQTMNSGVAEAVSNTYALRYYNGGWVVIYSSAYGIYPKNSAPTFSSATAASPTITVNRMPIYAKCNATYFSTSYAGKVDKDNSIIYFKFDIYRRDGGYDRNMIYVSLADMWNNGL